MHVKTAAGACQTRGPQLASFPDFGLVFDLGLVPCSQSYHLAEELLIDLAEDVGRQDRELVRAVRVVETADYLFERLVVDVEVKGEQVWFLSSVCGKLGTVPGRVDTAAIRYSPGFPLDKVCHQCRR